VRSNRILNELCPETSQAPLSILLRSGMQKYFAFIKKFFDFFRRHSDDDRSLMEKLRDKYRLVIMNDDTFEEVTSMKITHLSL